MLAVAPNQCATGKAGSRLAVLNHNKINFLVKSELCEPLAIEKLILSLS